MADAIKENLASYDKPYRPKTGDLVTLAGGTCGTWEVKEVEGLEIRRASLFSLGETTIGPKDGKVVVKNGQEVGGVGFLAEYVLRRAG